MLAVIVKAVLLLVFCVSKTKLGCCCFVAIETCVVVCRRHCLYIVSRAYLP